MIKGQVTLEVVLVVIVVVTVFITMKEYLVRSIRANLHNMQEQLNKPTTSVSNSVFLISAGTTTSCSRPTRCGVYPACYAADCLDVCNGSAIMGCNGGCNSGWKMGCDGVCSPSAKVQDICGVCGGDGSTCLP
jgi:hypothetical protein